MKDQSNKEQSSNAAEAPEATKVNKLNNNNNSEVKMKSAVENSEIYTNTKENHNSKNQIGENMNTASKQTANISLININENEININKLIKKLTESNTLKNKARGNFKVTDIEFQKLDELCQAESQIQEKLDEFIKSVNTNSKTNNGEKNNQSPSEVLRAKTEIIKLKKEIEIAKSKRAKFQEKLYSTVAKMEKNEKLDSKNERNMKILTNKVINEKQVISDYVIGKIQSNTEWMNNLSQNTDNKRVFRNETLKTVREILTDATLKKIINSTPQLQTTIVENVYGFISNN